MRKIIKEASELKISKKEKEEFIKNYISRELGKNDRMQKILFNAIMKATGGKKLTFEDSN